MGWHIHQKNGKFNIWSTVTNSYLLEWTDADTIKQYFIDSQLEEYKRRLTDEANIAVFEAGKKGCSIRYSNMCCDPEDI